jgi:hypothetical protein
MEYFHQNIVSQDVQKKNIEDQLKSMRAVYICFCNPNAGLGEHYDKPRFVFTQSFCADCEQIARDMDHNISSPAFDVILTELSVQYIFKSTDEEELHAKIPHQMIEAFTECAVVYGSTDMSWNKIVDTYDDLHPDNQFSASHLENYFLQLAFLITFGKSEE